MTPTTKRRLLALLVAAPLAMAFHAAAQTAGVSVKAGHDAYVAKGCFECHGYVGQGAIGVGARLAPPRLPVDAFRAYVRHPAGTMPPYSAKLVSDAEVAAIHAYLTALPKPRGAAAIPALAPYVAGNSSAASSNPGPSPAGGSIYRRYCAACHGAEREGAIGPRLTDEAGKRSLAQTLALIRNPPPGMPKLVPEPLSEADLRAVSAYIRAP
jgi:ubiquinol-cytochrome c reductase cytochrome c subunit